MEALKWTGTAFGIVGAIIVALNLPFSSKRMNALVQPKIAEEVMMLAKMDGFKPPNAQLWLATLGLKP
jgi:hypothetical protein